MKKTMDALLITAIIIPVVLLFWPFAIWNDAISLILRVIPALAAQVLLFRIGRWNVIRVLPALAAGALAAWGTYLWFTSPHWHNATFWGSLMGDYGSPFLACVVALGICVMKTKKRDRQGFTEEVPL